MFAGLHFSCIFLLWPKEDWVVQIRTWCHLKNRCGQRKLVWFKSIFSMWKRLYILVRCTPMNSGS